LGLLKTTAWDFMIVFFALHQDMSKLIDTFSENQG